MAEMGEIEEKPPGLKQSKPISLLDRIGPQKVTKDEPNDIELNYDDLPSAVTTSVVHNVESRSQAKAKKSSPKGSISSVEDGESKEPAASGSGGSGGVTSGSRVNSTEDSGVVSSKKDGNDGNSSAKRVESGIKPSASITESRRRAPSKEPPGSRRGRSPEPLRRPVLPPPPKPPSLPPPPGFHLRRGFSPSRRPTSPMGSRRSPPRRPRSRSPPPLPPSRYRSRSPRPRSPKGRPRSPLRGARSPPYRRSPPPRDYRARSPRYRDRSPGYRRSPPPLSRRSPPPRRYSPLRRRSPSTGHRRRSPRRSPSPLRRRRSPLRRSRSPIGRRSRSPPPRRSRSPLPRRSRTPLSRRSHSGTRRSRSPPTAGHPKPSTSRPHRLPSPTRPIPLLGPNASALPLKSIPGKGPLMMGGKEIPTGPRLDRGIIPTGPRIRSGSMERKRTRSPERASAGSSGAVTEDAERESKRRRTDEDMDIDSTAHQEPSRSVRNSISKPNLTMDVDMIDRTGTATPATPMTPIPNSAIVGKGAQSSSLARLTSGGSGRGTPVGPSGKQLPSIAKTLQTGLSSQTASMNSPVAQAPPIPPPSAYSQYLSQIQGLSRPESMTPELDAEAERLRLQRLATRNEHVSISAALRRAYHELALAQLDTKVAELRRISADNQLELAERGESLYVEENMA